jgi:hypothetical protein
MGGDAGDGWSVGHPGSATRRRRMAMTVAVLQLLGFGGASTPSKHSA